MDKVFVDSTLNIKKVVWLSLFPGFLQITQKSLVSLLNSQHIWQQVGLIMTMPLLSFIIITKQFNLDPKRANI